MINIDMRDLINLIESFGKVFNFDPEVDDALADLSRKAASQSITLNDIKSFNSLLNKDKNAFMRLYHGTIEDHPILTTGLRPTSSTTAKSLQSSHGYVYLAYDPKHALQFARMAYAGSKSNIVVYAVDSTIRRLLPDTDQLNNKRLYANVDVPNTLANSLIYGGGARIKGKIDTTNIHIHSVYDHTGKKID